MLLLQVWTAEDVHIAAADSQHSREVTCIFKHEIGGVGYNPYAIHSDPNVYGPGGLASFGLLNEFTRFTSARNEIADRYNPYQVANYIDYVLDTPSRQSNWPYLRTALATGRC